MGSKGNNRHIKRLAAHRYLNVERKVNPYVLKQNAGRHTLSLSIAIATLIKEKLGFAKTADEARRILKAGSVEVNGKVIKDSRYPVGFGDIILFKPNSEKYSVGVGSKGVVDMKKVESDERQVLKVTGKYIAKSNKEMIRLHDGTIHPSVKGVSVNDSVVLKGGKVGEVLKLEEGARCLVIKGVHTSEEGKVVQIKKGTALRDATVEISGKGGNTETLLDNIVVIGAK